LGGFCFQVSPGQKNKTKQKTTTRRSHLNGKKLGMVVCICHPSKGGKYKIRGWQSRPAWAKKQDRFSKITRIKRVGRVVQAVENQPSK
jgi:ribosomal protein L32